MFHCRFRCQFLALPAQPPDTIFKEPLTARLLLLIPTTYTAGFGVARLAGLAGTGGSNQNEVDVHRQRNGIRKGFRPGPNRPLTAIPGSLTLHLSRHVARIAMLNLHRVFILYWQANSYVSQLISRSFTSAFVVALPFR